MVRRGVSIVSAEEGGLVGGAAEEGGGAAEEGGLVGGAAEEGGGAAEEGGGATERGGPREG